MIINETVLRSRIRSLLLEERVYKIKEILEDIAFYRDFEEGEFQKIEQRLRSNWDRGYSKYSQVIKKDVINTEEPIDHILDAIDNFMPYYSKVGPQMTQKIGQGKLSSSDLRNYVEGQASDKLNKTRTSQREACRKQIPIREGQECKDFKVIHSGNDWTVVYPKTMLGSMSWAVGLADGSEEVYEVGSDGRQIGRVGWCTAAYTNNRFPMYAGNLHMYYFVKNKDYDISDNNRRLCISWVRLSNGEVQISNIGGASVDARNISLPKEKIPSLVGNDLIKKMEEDAASRKSTSLAEMASKVTLSMVKQDIENLKDDPMLLNQQLKTYAQHAKDDEIIRFFASYKDLSIRNIIASRKDLPKDIVLLFAQDQNLSIKLNIASNPSLPEVLIRKFLEDENKGVVNAAIENPSITNNIYNNLIEKSKFYWEKAEYDDDALDILISIIKNPKFKREHIDEMEKLPGDIVELLSLDQMIEDIYVSCPHLRGIIRETGIELDQTLLDDLAENLNLEESSLLKSYINMLLS